MARALPAGDTKHVVAFGTAARFQTAIAKAVLAKRTAREPQASVAAFATTSVTRPIEAGGAESGFASTVVAASQAASASIASATVALRLVRCKYDAFAFADCADSTVSSKAAIERDAVELQQVKQRRAELGTAVVQVELAPRCRAAQCAARA